MVNFKKIIQKWYNKYAKIHFLSKGVIEVSILLQKNATILVTKTYYIKTILALLSQKG